MALVFTLFKLAHFNVSSVHQRVRPSYIGERKAGIYGDGTIKHLDRAKKGNGLGESEQ
jgi:hypothetical protein